MTQPRAQTFQQKLGFQDKELSTPKHDELMFWLDKWIDVNLSSLVKIRKFYAHERWSTYNVSITEKSINGLTNLPLMPEVKPRLKKWECPILDRSYTIGFADMAVYYDRPELHFEDGSFKYQFTDHVLYFEVKPIIPSLGELLRQIRVYETYTKGANWLVVSPDTRFREMIVAQGFGFIPVGENREIDVLEAVELGL